MMKKHLFLSLLLSLFTLCGWAASSSVPEYILSSGKDFWVTFMDNYGANNDDVELKLFGVAPAGTSVRVYNASGSLLYTSTVGADGLYVCTVDKSQAYMTTSSVVENKGLHVQASADMSLYLANTYNNGGANISYDYSPVLATPALGYEYVVQTHFREKNATQFAVVGTEDATQVTIKFACAAQKAVGSYPAGSTQVFTLNAGQVIQFESSSATATFSGTTLIADKPVALFNGGVKAAIPTTGGAEGDHIEEQNIPIPAWGKSFVAVNMNGFPEGIEDDQVLSDRATQYCVTAIYDNTTVKCGSKTVTLMAGESTLQTGSGNTFMVKYTEAPKVISADKPVLCYAYTTNNLQNSYDLGEGEETVGEPSMVLIPSLRQGVMRADFVSSAYTENNYVVVIVPDAAKGMMRLNGAALSCTWNQLPNATGNGVTYAVATIPVSHMVNTLENASAPFVSYLYGVTRGEAKSVAFATVFNTAPAAPVVRLSNSEGDFLEVIHGATMDYCNQHPGVQFEAEVDYPHTGVRWELGEGASSTEMSTSHMYGKTIGESDTTHYVRFYVYRETPLAHIKDTDSICVYLKVHPVYYDTLVQYVPASMGAYTWKNSSPHAFGRTGSSQIDLVAGNVDIKGRMPLLTYTNLDTVKTVEKVVFDSLYYQTNEYHCDSIFYLELHIRPAEKDTVCQDQPYEWVGHNDVGLTPAERAKHKLYLNGAAITTIPTTLSGTVAETITVYDSMKNVYGTDSVDVLMLTIEPTPDAAFTDAVICANETSFQTVASAIVGKYPVALSVAVGGQTLSATLNSASDLSKTLSLGSNLTAGSYTATVTMTDDNGCEGTAAFTLKVNPLPEATFSNVVICADETSFSTTASDIVGTYPIALSVALGGQTLNATLTNASDLTKMFTLSPALAAGNYTAVVTMTDANGCVGTSNISVKVNANPEVTFTNAAICADELSFQTTATVAAGAYPMNLSVAVGGQTLTSTLANASDLTKTLTLTSALAASATPYPAQVTVTDPNCGAVTTSTFTLTVNPLPAATFTNAEICASETSFQTVASAVVGKYPIALSVAVGGQTLSATLNSASDLSKTLTLGSNLTAGSYTATVTMTDANGCEGTATFTLKVNPLPEATFSNVVICADETNFSTTASDIVGTYPIALSVALGGQTLNATLTNASDLTKTFTLSPALAAGNYTAVVTMTDANGCVGISNISVKVNANPEVTFTNAAICADELSFQTTATVAAGAYPMNLSVAVGGQTLTSTLANASDLTKTLTLTSALAASATPYPVVVTVTDPNCGAVTTSTFTLTVNPLPAATFTNAEICASETSFSTVASAVVGKYPIALSVAVGGQTLSATLNSASDLSKTLTLGSNLTAGSYTATVMMTDANGCEGNATFTLKVNANPVVSFANKVICANETQFTSDYTVSAGQYPIAYAMTLGGKNFSGTITDAAGSKTFDLVTALSAGTYPATFNFTDANGCTGSCSFTLKVNALSEVTFTDATICADATSVSTVATIVAGNPDIHYSIVLEGQTTIGTLTSSTSTVVLTLSPALSAGDHTATATLTDENNCSTSTTTFTVHVDELPSATFTNAAICEGELDFSTVATVSAGKYPMSLEVLLGGHTYSATLSSASDLTKNFTLTSALAAGNTYTATVKLTDDNGCKGTSAFTLTVKRQPAATFSNVVICADETSFSTTASAVVGDYPIALSVALGGQTLNATLANASDLTKMFTLSPALAAGNYTAVVTMTDANGCVGTSNISVKVNANPEVTFTNAAICADELSFQTTATVAAGAYPMTLSVAVGGQSLTSTLANASDLTKTLTLTSALAASATPYPVVVTVTDPNCGAVTTSTFTLTVNPLPAATFTNAEICASEMSFSTVASAVVGKYPIALSVAVGGQTLSATLNSASDLSKTLTLGSNLTAGSYTATVTMTDANGCEGTATFTLKVNPIPSVTLPAQTAQCYPIAAFPISYTHTDAAQLSYTVDSKITTPVLAAVTSSNSFTINTTGWPAGTYTLHVKPISANACEGAEKTVTITIKPQPTLTLNAIGNICPGEPTVVVTYSSVGADTYSYTLKKGSVLVDQQTAQPAQETGSITLTTGTLEPGTYTMTMTVNSALDCGSEQKVQTFEIYPKPAMTLTIADPNKCYPYKQKVVVNYTKQNADNYTFRVVNKLTSVVVGGLSGSNTTASGSFNLNLDIVDLPAGEYEVQAVPTATHGSTICTGEMAHTDLTIYPQPTVVLDPIADICETQDNLQFQFKTTDAKKAKIMVHDHAGRIADQVRNVTIAENNVYIPVEVGIYAGTPRIPAGTYTIKIVATSDKECPSDTAERTFTIEKKPVVTLSLTSPVCQKETVTATYKSTDATTCEYTLDGGSPITVAQTGGANSTFTIATAGLTAGMHAVVIVAKSATCESAPVTKQFVVNPTYEIDTVAAICDSSLPFLWHGKSITKPVGGPYLIYDSLKTVGCNCDSVIVLKLSISSATPILTDTTICSGDYFDWVVDNPCTGLKDTLMRHLSASCVQYDTLRNCNPGCNPVFQLNLNVYPEIPVEEETRVLCEGSSFVWHGQTISAPGVYEAIEDSVIGTGASQKCNATYRLIVTELAPVVQESNDRICSGDDYTFYGTTYPAMAAGIYTMTDTLASVGGCDSVYRVLHLTVNQPISYVETVDTCATPYIWRGHAYAHSGTYYDRYTSANGCDSTYVLKLTIKPSYHYVETYYYTKRELPVSLHEYTYTDFGTYTRTFKSVGGCDSVYTINLVELPYVRPTEVTNKSICEGDTYNWHGADYTMAGIYTDLTPDTLYELHLSVNNPYRDTVRVHICEGESYMFGGVARTATGYYTYTGTCASGCDSVVVLDLKVGAKSYATVNATACKGQVVSLGGRTFTATATISYNETLLNVAGCDSVITYNVVVDSPATQTETATICQGESYTWPRNGVTYTLPGSYTYLAPGASPSDCGTLYTLNLKMNRSYLYYEDIEVHSDALPYVWVGHHGNMEIRENGDYYDSLTTVLTGCDSVYHLHFHVDWVDRHDTTKVTACDTYTWNARPGHSYTYTASGIYSDTLWNALHNDYEEITFLDLTINHSIHQTISDIYMCSNEYLAWHCHNGVLVQDTTLTYTEVSSTGCDSIITAKVHVLPAFQDSVGVTVCETELPYVWRGKTLATAGIYADSLVSLLTGCDSVYLVNLQVSPVTPHATPVEQTMCSLDTLVWEGLTIANPTPGMHTYYKYYTVPGECDSTYKQLNLTVEEVEPIVTDTVACYGKPFTWYVDGVAHYSNDSVIADHTQTDTVSLAGCDKVYTLKMHVGVAPVEVVDPAVHLCAEENYTWTRSGQIITSAGSYQYIVPSVLTGCDSIIYHIEVSQSNVTKKTEPQAVICKGEPINFFGTEYHPTQDTILKNVVKSVVYPTCDSIVTTRKVTVNQPDTTFTNIVTCGRYEWHPYAGFDTLVTNVQYAAGAAADVEVERTLTIPASQAGDCQETYVLNLQLHPTYDIVEDTTVRNSQLPFDWVGHGQQFSQAGTYYDKKKTINACDSVYTLHLHVSPKIQKHLYDTICANQTFTWEAVTYTVVRPDTIIRDDLSNQDTTYNIHLHVNKTYKRSITHKECGTSYTWHGVDYTTSGEYQWDTVTTCGCDSIEVLKLTIGLPQTTTLPDATICRSELPYLWQGSYLNVLAADTVLSKTFSHATAAGCDSTVSMALHILPTYQTILPEVTICEGDEYVFGSHTLTTAGVYRDTLHAVNGCDSVLVQTIKTNPSYSFAAEHISTVNVPYIWHGQSIVATGIYYDSLTTDVYGCDSVYALNFKLGIPERDTITINECGSYEWRGTTYTISGFYRDTVWNAAHTDYNTIHHLSLTIRPEYHLDSVLTTSICEGDTLEWFGEKYYSSTTKTLPMIHTTLGCDSLTAKLVLTVVPKSRKTMPITVCQNQLPYTFNTHVLMTDTIVSDTLIGASATGCDSIVTLKLTVQPTEAPVVTDTTICTVSTLTWHDYVFDKPAAGDYTYVKEISLGECGSKWDTLYLHVTDITPIPTDTTICYGSAFDWYIRGQLRMEHLTETGVYHDTISIGTDCDEVHVLNLTVRPEVMVRDSAISLCAGESMVWRGQTINHAGTFTAIGEGLAAGGCDSTFTLTVSMPTMTIVPASTTICLGEAVDFGGTTYYPTKDTVVYDTLAPVAPATCPTQCNKLTVKVVRPFFDEKPVIRCGSYYWSVTDSTYTESTNDTIVLTSVLTGCDSTYILHLTINEEYSQTEARVVTPDSIAYTWHGYTFKNKQAGTYTADKLFHTAAGCDSIFHMSLTVSPFIPDTTRGNICEGGSYTWPLNGQNYDHAGSYVWTDNTDHPHLLILAVHPTFHKDTTVALCAASYAWHGQTYTTSGTYSDSHISVDGCDSTYILHLTLGAPQATTLKDTTCAGTLYEWKGLTHLAVAGTDFSLQKTYTTKAGCDSVVTVDVHVLPTYETILPTVTICRGETYTWFGEALTAAGEYRRTLTAESGCDSVLVLSLELNEPYFHEENVNVHEQTLPFPWIGHKSDTLLYTTGNYYDHGTTVDGCDSTYLIRFHVGFAKRDTISAEACGSYSWRDSLYTETGFYRDTVWDAAHADYDSIYNLKLTIYPQYDLDSTLSMTICEGDTIEWFGQQYWSTTTDTRVLTTVANGCDSLTANLTLTVLPTKRETETATICQGETYEFNGRLFSETTQVSDTLSSVLTGCDSIITLNLTVLPVKHDTTEVTMCSTSHFYWDGFMHENLAPGTHTFVSLPYGTCGSDSTLILTVLAPNDTVLTDATICQGDKYSWVVTNPYTMQPIELMRNLTTTQSQVVVLEIPSDTLLCGAAFRLNLTVMPSHRRDTTVTICTGGSYVWRGQTYTEEGTYYDSLLTASGCDSVLVLHLQQTAPQLTYDTAYLCKGTPFTFAGEVLTKAGIYRDTVGTGSCIEAIHELLLLQADTTLHIDAQQVCAEVYIWNGRRLTETGVYRDTLTSLISGCDSVVDLHLYLLKTKEIEETKHITTRQLPYTWYDYTYNAAGDYYETVTSMVTACDSIRYTLHLIVDPTIVAYADPVEATLCAGETYTWSVTGETYATSVDTSVLVNDTVYQLQLTILPDYRRTEHKTICSDQLPYNWNGLLISAAGTYPLAFTTADGCDSTQTLVLTVSSPVSTSLADTICDGETYSFGSQLLTTTGVYTETYTTASGCDSVVTLSLYVHTTLPSDTVAAACGTFDWYGHTYTASGDYLRTFVGQYGCDSVVTLHLTIQPQYLDTADVEVNEEALPYVWSNHRSDTLLRTNGIYYDSLQTVDGCDSIYTLHFHVGFVQRDTIDTITCDNYTWPATGLVYDESGAYRDTVFNAAHTDFTAIHYLNLTICGETKQTTAPDEHLCKGDAITLGGVTYTPSQDTVIVLDLKADNGICDSIVTTHVYVHSATFQTEAATICADQSYYWHGQVLTADSVYTDSLVSVYGCDSVWQLTLSVNPVFHDTVAPIHMCTSDVLDWGGYHFEDRDTGNFVYHSVPYDACGSDSVLYLRIDQSFDSLQVDSISDSEAYGLWRDTIIPILPAIQPFTEYMFYDSLISSAGCDSVYALKLIVGPTYLIPEEIDLCQNDSLWWHDSIRYAGNLADPVHGLVPGTVIEDTLRLKTVQFGYDSIYTLQLTVRPIYENNWSATICPTDSIEFTPGRWVHEEGVYDTILTTIYGCDSVCQLTLSHYPQYDSTYHADACYATDYYWAETDSTYLYYEAGIYTDSVHLYTINGCDSIIRLELKVENLSQKDTTIEACLEDSIHWPHRFTSDTLIWYTPDTIGKYLVIDTVFSPLGCEYHDSIYINVVQPVVFDSAWAGEFCADNGDLEVFYQLDTIGGEPRYYSLYYSAEAKAQGFRDMENIAMANTGSIVVPTYFTRDSFPRPDTYQATLYLNNGSCRDTSAMVSVPFSFEVLYPAWFAEQHWNNTITVLSPEYNASVMKPEGYTFVAYQWYMNGEKIDGEDAPMLRYLHNLPTLNEHDTITYPADTYFQVELTRADDGKVIKSCPIYPEQMYDPSMPIDFYFSIQPTYVDHGSPYTNILSNTKGTYTIFDPAGRRISEGVINKDVHSCEHGVTGIELPYVTGTYLVRMESDEPNPYDGKILVRTVKVLVY